MKEEITMPWKIKDVDQFKKDLTDAQKEQWVEIANSVYESCIADGGTDEDCAPKAIKQANGAVEKKSVTVEKEVRSLPEELAEVRASKDSRTIEGFGIVFNKESRDLGGFKEVILPEAVEGIVEQSDILALLNHDISRGVLARSTKGKGTLSLTPDNKGVKYRFDAPNFDLGNELLENVRRGDIKSTSFSFSVSGGQKWDKLEDGSYLRTITKFDEIFDISPCYREAYEDTTIAIRCLDEFKNNETENVKPPVEEPTDEPIAEHKLSDDERFLRHGGINY